LLGLYREGVLRPGVAEIAERAGVSERSVFRHFQDLEGLAAAAIERHWEEVGHLFDPPDPSGCREDRIDAYVSQRLALHAAVAPVARAAQLLAPSSPTIADTLTDRDRLLRSQVAAQFAPELADRTPADRTELLTALDLAASFRAIEHLQVGDVGPRRARAAVRRTVAALLATPARPPRTTEPGDQETCT
jgi:AcrR family transcriptional regulator